MYVLPHKPQELEQEPEPEAHVMQVGNWATVSRCDPLATP